MKTYESIVKGYNVPKPGVPESFKVLVKELQALCLDIQVLDDQGNQIELKDDDEDEVYQSGRFREDDFDRDRYRDMGSESEFAQAGFTMKETSDDDDLIAADLAADSDEEYFGGDED